MILVNLIPISKDLADQGSNFKQINTKDKMVQLFDAMVDKIKENIKHFLTSSYFDDLFWVSLIIFVGIGSFALGVRSERQEALSRNPIEITEHQEIENAWHEYIQSRKSTAEFFASKNGTVYYPLACPSGQRIKQENRIYFTTVQEAQSAGYKESSQCN